MTHAMPSPRGTNLERLFIRPHHNPTMAMDAAMPSSPSDGTIERILEFLAGKLDDADIDQVRNLLAEQQAGDEPPPFRGQPLVGGRQRALDALPVWIRRQAVSAKIDMNQHGADAFASRFPEAARIKVI